MTLSSQLKGQSRYEIHESEEEPREMLCLLIGTHSGRTYDWLFRKAEKPYHLSICMWAGKEKILAVKFLAWGHQLVTSRMLGKNLSSDGCLKSSEQMLTCYWSAWSFPETKVATQRLDAAVQGVFTPQLHPASASWIAKAKWAQWVLPEPAWACKRHLGLPFVSAVLLLSSAQSGCLSLCFWFRSQSTLTSCGNVFPQPWG